MERRVMSTELPPIFQATDSIALQWWLLLLNGIGLAFDDRNRIDGGT